MSPNTIEVRVSEAGGVFELVQIAEGSTVETALRAAGANLDSAKRIRINMEEDEADLTDTVENGDTIYVVPQIKGN